MTATAQTRQEAHKATMTLFDRGLVTPSGVPYDTLTPDDVAIVDIAGVVQKGPHKPSSEVPMHLRLYSERPAVKAIVHSHSPHATAFSLLREPNGTGIYQLLRPGDFSAMHRLEGPELWHHYAGAPVDMLLLDLNGSVQRPALGADLAVGRRPYVAVPAGVWMGGGTTGEWSLIGATIAPPFREEGFEIGRREDLVDQYPSAAADIARFIREEHP